MQPSRAAPYGVTRPRLWTMDRGYACRATCSGAVPDVAAALPAAAEMCAAPAGRLEPALVRRPSLFDALWQDDATKLNLQLAFKPWRSDTPARLLAFAKPDAGKGSEIDPDRLSRYAEVHRGLAP